MSGKKNSKRTSVDAYEDVVNDLIPIIALADQIIELAHDDGGPCPSDVPFKWFMERGDLNITIKVTASERSR